MLDKPIILLHLRLYFHYTHFVTLVLLSCALVKLLIGLQLVCYLKVSYFELVVLTHHLLRFLLSDSVSHLLLQFDRILFLFVVLVLYLMDVLL